MTHSDNLRDRIESTGCAIKVLKSSLEFLRFSPPACRQAGLFRLRRNVRADFLRRREQADPFP